MNRYELSHNMVDALIALDNWRERGNLSKTTGNALKRRGLVEHFRGNEYKLTTAGWYVARYHQRRMSLEVDKDKDEALKSMTREEIYRIRRMVKHLLDAGEVLSDFLERTAYVSGRD